jgi:hypothetical protein
VTSVTETAPSSPCSMGLTGRGEFLKSSAGGGERTGDPIPIGVEVPGVPLKRGIVVPGGGVPYCCLSWRILGVSDASSSPMSRSERTGLPIFTGFEGGEDMTKKTRWNGTRCTLPPKPVIDLSEWQHKGPLRVRTFEPKWQAKWQDGGHHSCPTA